MTDSVYGRLLEVNFENTHVDDIQGLISSSGASPDRPIFTKNLTKHQVYDTNWSNRNEITPINKLQFETSIIIVSCTNSQFKELDRYNNVYQVIHKGTKCVYPGAKGLYIDIRTSNYSHLLDIQKTWLYLADLYFKPKMCMKIWKHLDYRSMRHIDMNVYKDCLDPQSGRIPNIITATILHVLNTNPDRQLSIIGLDTPDLPAYDQQLLTGIEYILCG